MHPDHPDAPTLPDPSPIITEETTAGQIELELARIGATLQTFPLTTTRRSFYDDIPAAHRIGVFVTAETLAATGTGVTFAQALNAAIVRLRSSLQRMYETNRLPAHVVMSPTDNELLS